MISSIPADWHTQARNPTTDPKSKSTDPTTGWEWPQRRRKETNLDVLDRAVPPGQFESKVGHLINVRPLIRVWFQHVPWQNHHHKEKDRGGRAGETEIECRHVTDGRRADQMIGMQTRWSVFSVYWYKEVEGIVQPKMSLLTLKLFKNHLYFH